MRMRLMFPMKICVAGGSGKSVEMYDPLVIGRWEDLPNIQQSQSCEANARMALSKFIFTRFRAGSCSFGIAVINRQASLMDYFNNFLSQQQDTVIDM
eukprot:7176869-Karenia_brevis.AAC.1